MVFQHFGLLAHRRVIDNVALGVEVQGARRTVEVITSNNCYEFLNLEGDKISTLCMGCVAQ